MKKIACLLLSLTLLFSFTAAAAPTSGPEQPAIKDETVYANLNADGSISRIYVVNRLETPKEGRYVDYGIYQTILNLSGRQQPGISGDKLSWEQEEETLYYQGQLAKGELPFTFSFAYSLDGNPVAPAEAIGKAGAAAITLKVEPNPRAKAYFRDNYVAQLQVPLDLEVVSGIRAPGAASVIAGKTATLAYTVLPGQKADYRLEFETSKFQLDSIAISCLPFDSGSFLDLDLDEMTAGFEELTKGLDQLAGGSKKLQSGVADLAGALGKLSGGADELAIGMGKFSAGLPQLLAGTKGLKEGALALADGIGQLAGGASGLGAGASQLAAGISSYTAAAGQLHQGVLPLNGGLAQLSQEGAGLTGGYGELVGGLNQALAGLQTQLTTNLGLTPEQQQGLGQILGSMGAELNEKLGLFGQGLQEYTGGVAEASQGLDQFTLGLEAFAGEGNGLVAGASSLASGSGSISQGLYSLQDGSSQLAAGLVAFAEESQGLGTGADKLNEGAKALAGGLREITAGTSRLPGDVRVLAQAQAQLRDGFKEAAGFLGDFNLPEGNSEPVSFVSDKVAPRSVQFVASTPAFKAEGKSEQLPESPKEQLGFFKRLLKLFGLNK